MRTWSLTYELQDMAYAPYVLGDVCLTCTVERDDHATVQGLDWMRNVQLHKAKASGTQMWHIATTHNCAGWHDELRAWIMESTNPAERTGKHFDTVPATHCLHQ